MLAGIRYRGGNSRGGASFRRGYYHASHLGPFGCWGSWSSHAGSDSSRFAPRLCDSFITLFLPTSWNSGHRESVWNGYGDLVRIYCRPRHRGNDSASRNLAGYSPYLCLWILCHQQTSLHRCFRIGSPLYNGLRSTLCRSGTLWDKGYTHGLELSRFSRSSLQLFWPGGSSFRPSRIVFSPLLWVGSQASPVSHGGPRNSGYRDCFSGFDLRCFFPCPAGHWSRVLPTPSNCTYLSWNQGSNLYPGCKLFFDDWLFGSCDRVRRIQQIGRGLRNCCYWDDDFNVYLIFYLDHPKVEVVAMESGSSGCPFPRFWYFLLFSQSSQDPRGGLVHPFNGHFPHNPHDHLEKRAWWDGPKNWHPTPTEGLSWGCSQTSHPSGAGHCSFYVVPSGRNFACLASSS